MCILEEDESHLIEKGYNWKIHQDPAHGLCLVISNFSVNSEKFNVDKTDLLIIIPAQYNNCALDMYYVNPEVRKKDGSYPQAADQPFDCLGKKWQRFSRHMPNWRPGVDSLLGFLILIKKELQ